MFKFILAPIAATALLASCIQPPAPTDMNLEAADAMCSANFEQACRTLAAMTDGQCATPGAQWGCKYDSDVEW